MKRWYVVHTQTNKESKAALHLQRQGFEIYLPRYLRVVNHARTARTVVRPLFQRYLFVQLNTEIERWRSINGTFGVSYVITSGEHPLPTPKGMVEAIRQRENEQGLVGMLPPVYEVGQRLEVIEGPLAMADVFFQKFTGNNKRVMVLLEMLGRTVQTSMPASTVVAA